MKNIKPKPAHMYFELHIMSVYLPLVWMKGSYYPFRTVEMGIKIKKELKLNVFNDLWPPYIST